MSIFSFLSRRLSESHAADGGTESPAPFEPQTVLPAPSAAASPIHLIADGARVRVDNGVVKIEGGGTVPVERPIEWVSSIHIYGHATISSPAVSALVSAGAPVLWRGHHGYPLAVAQPMSGPGVAARRAQYAAASDSTTRLKIARALVAAKIVSLRGVLRRRVSEGDSNPLRRLTDLSRKAEHAKSREELLGYEGAAGALYFGQWTGLLRHHADHIAMSRRTRRPPQDAPNAALSYFYAVLTGERVCAAAAVGLDPRLGFLHEEREGRPALALDLLELFRPTVADTTALMALNTGELNETHFERRDGGGCHLTSEGRRAALQALERRLSTRAFQAPSRLEMSWRAAIEVEARGLRAALVNGKDFKPMARA